VNPDQLFGALIGLVLGVVGNYIFEGLGFKTKAAKLSWNRAQARLKVVTKRLEEAENYHQNPVLLVSLVSGRLLLVTFLWILQSAADYLLGLLNNGLYAVTRFIRPLDVDRDLFSTSVGLTGSVLGSLVLLITAKLALDVYVVWRRVHRFDRYRPKIEAEVTELKAVLQNTDAGGPGI
jgi:uncharacterized membrane protein